MKLVKLLGIISLIIIGLYYYSRFVYSLSAFYETQNSGSTIFVVFILIFVFLFLLSTTHVPFRGKLSYAVLFYFLWLWISSLIATAYHPLGSTNLIGLLLVPLLAFYLMYKEFYIIGSKSRVYLVVLISSFVVLLSVQYLLSRASVLSIITYSSQASGGAYYALVLLPFVLLIPNNLLKYILSLFLLVVSVFSAKRGGSVAVSAAIISSVVLDFFVLPKNADNYKRLKYLLIFVMFIIGVYYIPYLFSEETIGLLERFEDDDYKTNSRSMIYSKVFHMIISSDIIEFFIGHGWDSVLRDGAMGYSAHNDFLESFYDFGFIGFVLYLNLHFQLIKESIRLIKKRSMFASPFLASWVLFLIFGLLSHVILYPPMAIAFSLFWGSVKGTIESEKKISLKNKRIEL